MPGPVKELFWRMTQGKIMEGVFAVNKPKMISSAQVLRDLQKHFNPSELFAPWISMEKTRVARENHNQRKKRRQKETQVKIGHGGTLDPLATGVLITGIGSGTKSLQDFLLCTKTYEAVILFGTSTDSYDRVGKVLRRAPYEHVTKDMVEESLKKFRGKFKQLPPLFSALKMNGKPLYEYAREGKELPREIERRDVEVLDLELVEWMDGDTHTHEAPSEEAGEAEINLATNMWKQEGALPPGKNADEDSTPAEFENRKRKLGESQDDLVQERPASKRKMYPYEEEAKMSGGLDAANAAAAEGAAVASESEVPVESAEIVADEESLIPKLKGPPAAKIRMTVTSGFYVRSLCHDIGIEVGSAALMAELERTRQEKFEVGKNCLEYEDLQKGEAHWGPKVEAMLDEWYERKHGKAPPKGTPSASNDVESKQEAGKEVPSAPVADTAGPEAEAATEVPSELDAVVAETEPEAAVASKQES